LQNDLERIDWAANILPLRHSNMFLPCSFIPTKPKRGWSGV
jgi:hypothetical protein